MSKYRDIIKSATGCCDADVQPIEEFMRRTIFHSTLDWQTKDELIEAARLAQSVLQLEQESEV